MSQPSPFLRHVFGPVPSRRLGRSLGVDLVPFKTCTYDCVYCQLGRTTRLTVERREWVPIKAVLAELDSKLACQPDYITLSGSGEPTLHSQLGDVIEHIKTMTDLPVALLTNGSLLWQKAVREQAALADVVLPSLDAAEPTQFGLINRPHPEITFESYLEGLESFRREFNGQYWLEVMLLDGCTSEPAQVRRLADCIRRIRPDRIQLNTAVRPAAEASVRALSPDRLAVLARCFEPQAEVIAEHQPPARPVKAPVSRQDLLAFLQRRPCTIDGMALGLGLHPHEVAKQLADLEARGSVRCHQRDGQIYYCLPAQPSGSAGSPGDAQTPFEPLRPPLP